MKLPKKLEISMNNLSQYYDMDEQDIENLNEAITDYLSDTYGFCINGLNWDISINISDIDWDMELEDQ